MTPFTYVGQELSLFAAANNWKRYWSAYLQPYICGDVLEVGAGAGANTPYLDHERAREWVCIEPDGELFGQLTLRAANGDRARPYRVVHGTIAEIACQESFDTVVYVDVLEHIEADCAELNEATLRLRPGGRIVVLSPAHNWLFSPFDAAIGHFRRYDKTSLRKVTPAGCAVEMLAYLDSVGLLASAANKILMRQRMPTAAQIALWDKAMVPASRIIDVITGRAIGKSIVGVWRKL